MRSLLTLLASVVFLLLFLLLEFVLLENLPKLSELWLVVKRSTRHLLQVVAGSHCALVVGAQFCI